ncbi:hypothetical protein G9A89_012641 [Geosiphon pyriformis]|nr:hypothetical protein G9A89_012641 [Geosiphon pyriformis]
MSRHHARSLRLGIKQEWQKTQFLFHPRLNSTVSEDESTKLALRHFFNSQNILIAFGPGSIRHHPNKVAIRLFYYAPTTNSRNRREAPGPSLNLSAFFAPKGPSSSPGEINFTAFPTGNWWKKKQREEHEFEESIKPEQPVNVAANLDSLSQNDSGKSEQTDITSNTDSISSSMTTRQKRSSMTMAEILADVYRKPVELSLTRLHYPYLNSYILAQFIAINSTRHTIPRILRAIFKKVPITTISTKSPLIRRPIPNLKRESGPPNPLEWTKLIRAGNFLMPVHLAGIRIEIAGRMGTRKGASRTTNTTKSLGSFHFKQMTHSMIDYSKVEGKNRNGSFTVKVWISSACTEPRELSYK